MSGKEHVLRIDVTWIYEYGSTHDQTSLPIKHFEGSKTPSCFEEQVQRKKSRS